MDKIRLSSADIEFVLNWRDEHKDLVRMGMSPLKYIKIECFESGYEIKASRDGQLLTLSVSQKGKSLGKLVFENHRYIPGYCSLVQNTTKLNEEDCQAVLTVYSSTMALIVFGKATISSQDGSREIIKKNPGKKAKKKQKPGNSRGATYILSWGKTTETKDTKTKHKSPSHAFSVRGHFRHYKSGKVIWIEEFTKCSGKKHQDKTYKIGAKKNGGKEMDRNA